MFPALRSEVSARFENIRRFFEANSARRTGHLATTAKGLVFVQIYAVYEYTINQTVSQAIESIKKHRHRIGDLSPQLLALVLDPELRSLRDVQRKHEWDRRLRLFERAFSGELVDLSGETQLPTDRSHYRASQLELIFKVFGISRMPVRRHRHKDRIAEVVGHRNAIAHGRETPEDIGRRYTSSEIRKAIQQIESVCLLWITVFDDYSRKPERQRRRRKPVENKMDLGPS